MQKRGLLLAMAAVGFACTGVDETTPPDAPGAALDPVSCSTQVVLTGAKPSGTSIWVDGKEVVIWDEATTYMITLALEEGRHVLSVTARDANGKESVATAVETRVSTTPPAAPVVNAPASTTEATATISGTREPGTAILADGVEQVPAGDDPSWSFVAPLAKGENHLVITARGPCQDSKPADAYVVRFDAGEPHATLDRTSFAARACTTPQVLRGEKGAEDTVYVNGTAAMAGDDDTHWRYTANLRPGRNAFAIVAQRGAKVSSAIEISIAYSDGPPAPPMVNGAVPQYTREPTLVVSGTKPADTAITFNGARQAKPDETTSWTQRITLADGPNRILIDTEDFCSRISGRPVDATVILDRTPPTVRILAPTQNLAVAGRVTIRGTAMDDARLAEVEVAVDGAVIARLPMQAAWSTTWDTTRVADRLYMITAVAVDAAGNRSMPGDRIDVTVANQPRLVSDDLPAGEEPAASSSPAVAALIGSDDVAIVWQDRYAGYEQGADDDIFLRVYANVLTETPIVAVSDHRSDGRSRTPAIAAGPGGVANIVWTEDGAVDGDRNVDDDIVFRQRAADGTLSNIVVVSRETGSAGDSRAPAIATNPTTGVSHVVWEDDGDLDQDGAADADIYYAAGGPGGFNSPVLISNAADDGASSRPKIALTPDGCPHIVWAEGAADIHYRGSIPNGLGGCTFGPITLITEEAALRTGTQPAITADPEEVMGTLWVAFTGSGSGVPGFDTDPDVYLRNVIGGLTGTLIKVSDYGNDAVTGGPSVAVTKDRVVHVAFQESGDLLGSGADADIFIRSFDGTRLGAPDSLGVGNTGASLAPMLVTRDAQRFVVWQDDSDYDQDRTPDFDIMYMVR